jgi:hypothetical protein
VHLIEISTTTAYLIQEDSSGEISTAVVKVRGKQRRTSWATECARAGICVIALSTGADLHRCGAETSCSTVRSKRRCSVASGERQKIAYGRIHVSLAGLASPTSKSMAAEPPAGDCARVQMCPPNEMAIRNFAPPARRTTAAIGRDNQPTPVARRSDAFHIVSTVLQPTRKAHRDNNSFSPSPLTARTDDRRR